ncbi:hypothetical protein EIK77_000929 [Talaromyces pinophilus]|nr:hypothetical protein EIK77_000929 [Talaromyces pinophilus]
MDQCYINLAVVQCSRLAKSDANEKSKTTTSQQSSPFSLFSRLKIDAVGSGSLVSLDTLFEPQKQFNGEFVRPKRILVQGAAGVGKTTLCKKIVHDYYHHEMWQNLFDWILWVPLRRLKLMSPVKECNLGRFFSDEYFSHYPEGKKFGQAMWEAVDTSARDKTLFILDGLDEVSGEWSSDTPMHKLLRDLLDMPQVIITTRPYRLSRTDLEPLDLELETIGFLPDQVAAYVQNPRIVRPKDTATQIQDFIQKHVLIRELVRIPIQLDALCHSWNGDFLKDMPRAMTTIYKAIVLKLWQKDILALEIRHRGELLKKREAQDLLESEITNLTQNIMNLIEFLAFTGLYSDVIEFRAEVRKQIYNHKELCEKFPDMPDSILRKLSFLRTADETLGDDVRSYHFLHLTFQEFFAAQYFVTHWVEGKDLLCLPLWRARAKPSPKNPEKFLQEEKYNSRYDIFWRFVAGLLHEQGEDQLRRFFKILEDKPQDLLGPSHQRILMHCFSEVPRNSLEDLRIRVEGHLKQWALFENKIHGRMTLCYEMEFPDHALHTMMKEEPEDVKKGILQALQYRPQLSSHLLKWIASFLGREKIAIDILRKQYTLPEDILHGIVARLEDSDCNVRQAASSVLDKQPTLSEGILHAIVTRLEHSHSRVRWSAINALGKQSALSEDILQAIATRLKDSDRDVRQTAFDVLGKQSTLSEGILHAIITQLEDSDWHIRSFAINTLSKQSTLSENILYTIVTQLEDTDCDVRQSAINALGKQSILSESILHVIVARLEDFHWDVRKAAFDVLGEQSTLSESVLHAIVTRLEHSRSSVRWSAIKALGKQSALSENIIHVMMARLEDSDEFVRWSTINALGQQSTLSESVLHVIVARLEDFHWDVRKAASDVLGEQSTLSESVLHAIVTRLEHSRSSVRWSAIKALDKQSALSENTLQAIISRLEDSDGDVRQSAIDALGKQSTLSESFLHVIAAQLDNSDCHMRRSAIQALDKQSALSEDILQAIVPRLEDSDWDVRWLVIKILDKQSTLSESILHSIITRLKHSNSYVRESAINALSKQSTLSENILHIITTQLGDSNSAVRRSTMNVLSKQSTLSEDTLYAIVIQLGHSSSGVRQSAITTLGKQSALSEDILQAIATQLDDSDEDVRCSAINVLGRQSALSDDILQAIVTRLEDSDRDVRWSAINALDKQTTLSASILQALLLSKSSLDIRSKAVSVLLKQDSLYNGFLTFDTKILRSIYYTLIRQSFSEQLSCYKHDGIIYIDLPDRRREISLVQERPFVWNKNAHLGDFRDEAFALGRPTSTAEDLKFMQTPWYLDIYLIVVICFMFL